MAIQFALLALPLCVLTFGLMDVNRATVAKQRLQDALDAATLLAAKTTSATTDTALAAVGTPALNANLTNLAGATVSSSSFHLNGAYIDASATIQMTPIVANLWMSGDMNITATSQVVRTLDDLEVAMVLDNTGSMASTLGSTTKISALKTAAASLIDTLAAAAANSSDPNAVKYAVVPFSMTVNVGSTYKNATWMTGVMPTSSGYNGTVNDTFSTAGTNRFTMLSQMGLSWGGCVESRPAPYDVQDTSPSSSTPDTMFIPFFAPDEPDTNTASNGIGGYWTSNNNYITKDQTNATTWAARTNAVAKYAATNTGKITATGKTAGHGPNEGCAIAPLQRLTTSASTAKTTLNAMVATGNTNVAMGLVWGWHTVSPNAPFADGVAYGTAHHDKIIILLTDGDNTNDEYNGSYPNSIYSGLGYITEGRLRNTSGVALTKTSTGSERMDAIDGRELALCANMKAQNVIIYSIGVGVSTHSKGLLQTCASGSDHYYDVTDASQLTNVFNAIAGSIQNLRISK